MLTQAGAFLLTCTRSAPFPHVCRTNHASLLRNHRRACRYFSNDPIQTAPHLLPICGPQQAAKPKEAAKEQSQLKRRIEQEGSVPVKKLAF